VWGIEQAIEYGLDIDESLQRTYQQNGVSVFSHLLLGLFHGCGLEVFDEMYRSFKSYPLGVEQNGQISWMWDKIFGSNREVRELAEEREIACFGTSDIHGTYRQEHRKVGSRFHSSLHRDYVDPEKLRESLAEVMTSNPEAVQIEGNSNSLLESILWNVASVRKNGWEKIADLMDGALQKGKNIN
jgi:hypothetical protein